jgi:serine/threonine-protein kinase
MKWCRRGSRCASPSIDEHGLRLGLVHRDVSPQNILVGLDGVSRITDFGIAKVRTGDAMVRTATGHLKGKIGYMAPEYIRGQALDRRSDEFSLAVVVWEALTGQRLFRGGNELETMMRAINAPVPPLSRYVEGADGELDMIFERALERSPEARYRTLLDFQNALEMWAGTAGMLATRDEVARYVERQAGEKLAARRALVRRRLADLDGGEAQSKSGKRLIREIPPATGSETSTTAVTPLIQTRRGTSRAALIGLAGAVIGAATVLFVQSRNEEPAPAAESAPEVSVAPSASSPPSTSASAAPPAASSVAPMDAGVPIQRPLVRPLPTPKTATTPDPNPYGP